MRRIAVKRDKDVTPTFLPENSDLSLDTSFEQGAHGEIEPNLRHRMVSEATYYIETQRGCADGYDMDDWLQAQKSLDPIVLNSGRSNDTGVKRS